ncbi:unnamed protein product [Schistosoma haematobium]|nr:unnamed protein product [Schistosoma haematobium]
MQALVSFVANSGDELQLINTTDEKFLFVSRSHLILVAFSPVSEPTPHLLTCLEYVYNQIISSLTLQRVEKQFTRHANLDLRKLLVGDNRLLSSIINRVEETFGVFLNAISCTPLPENSRAAISQIICQNAKLRVTNPTVITKHLVDVKIGMNSFYHNLPKIELHAHLSGSISSAFLKRESITNRDVQNINPGFDFETWNGDVNRCFDAFRTIHKLIETPEILERATTSVIEEFHQENVILLELRTTLRPIPTHRSYLNAVIRGIQNAPSTDLKVLMKRYSL